MRSFTPPMLFTSTSTPTVLVDRALHQLPGPPGSERSTATPVTLSIPSSAAGVRAPATTSAPSSARARVDRQTDALARGGDDRDFAVEHQVHGFSSGCDAVGDETRSLAHADRPEDRVAASLRASR